MSGLVTSSFQVEFDGFLMGPGTPYQFTKLDGFLDLAGARQNFTSRARQRGTYNEPRFTDGAVYNIEMDVTATATMSFADAIQAVTFATTPPRYGVTRPLFWMLPGAPELTLANVQVLRRSIPIATGYEFGLAQTVALQFYASDPYKYGAGQSASTALSSGSGGLTYPLVYPLTYGTQVASRVNCVNAGSADAYPILTVIGPIDRNGFIVTAVESGITVTYNGPVGANDSLVIDTSTGAAVLNSQNDRRSLLSMVPGPPVIPAQSSQTFAFTTPGGYTPTARLTVGWANTYS